MTFDTSALISLGHTNLVGIIIDTYTPVVTASVIRELETAAERDDLDGRSANRWLEERPKLMVRKVSRLSTAEEELFQISKKDELPLITDDIKAVRRYESKVDCFFSIHIVYALYSRSIITRAQALVAIEKMKEERTWRDNAIAVAAKRLFE